MSTSLDIGLLTCASHPRLQADYRLIHDELIARGYAVQPVIWNRDDIQWEEIDNIVICSAWDYHENYESFRNWLAERRKHCKVINPPEIVSWNLEKTYLKHFESAGLPVVPTIWLDKGAALSETQELPWDKIVVKPSVGASSSGMKRFNLHQEFPSLQEHVARLATHSGVMIQPYLSSADRVGETALMYFNGRFSHAINRPLTGVQADLEVSRVSYKQPSQTQMEIGSRVLSCLPSVPAYCRVDLLSDDEQKDLVLEVEMIEPSLFFAAHPPSAVSFADALEERWIQAKR